MDAVTNKRLRIIISVVYFALILGAFYLIFKTFFGILVPFIAAFLIAAVLHRPVQFITRKTPLRRSLVSTVFVLLILGAVGLLIFFAGSGLVDKLKSFYQFIILKLRNLSDLAEYIKTWLLGAIGFLPEKLRLSLSASITEFFRDLEQTGLESFSLSNLGIDWSSIVKHGGGMIKNTVVQIPSVLIAIVISVVACVFITIDYDKITAFIGRQFSDRNRKKLIDAKNLAKTTLSQMAKAYGLIILITTTELTVGFYILKFCKIFNSDFIVPLSLLIAIIDIIPVLGTGTVLIPWAVYSFITGDVAMGIGLIVLYAVILVIRQVIEPKLVAGQVGLSPIVTIIAMYVGTKTLGVLGFFILPFGVILIKKFNDEGIIHLFKSAPEYEEPVPVGVPAPEPEPAAGAREAEAGEGEPQE